MSEVKMETSDSDHPVAEVRRRPRASTTLNRKYVSRPKNNADISVSVKNGTVKKSPKVSHFGADTIALPRQTDQVTEKSIVEVHPMQEKANRKLKARRVMVTEPSAQPKLTAQELKERAIKKALAEAEAGTDTGKGQKVATKAKMHFGFGRLVLALTCAAVAVFAIVYFVNLNMPDISLKVAAMQTGINASYPSYVPRDYNISSITSENGKVTLEFSSSALSGAFTLVEEASSWDSNALLTNYVKDKFGDNYTVVREQGLTIYLSGSDAAWVNGGIVYKLDTTAGSLTNKQIKSIATSL